MRGIENFFEGLFDGHPLEWMFAAAFFLICAWMWNTPDWKLSKQVDTFLTYFALSIFLLIVVGLMTLGDSIAWFLSYYIPLGIAIGVAMAVLKHRPLKSDPTEKKIEEILRDK